MFVLALVLAAIESAAALLEAAAPCDALHLLPAPPTTRQLFRNHSWPSWGGTVVRGAPGDAHKYHLFAASFVGGCGLDGWIRNGVAIHAVADQPAGPFSFHDVALPVFQHNPHAIKHPDGTYLLFGIGQANNASWQCPCKDGKPIMPDGKPTTDADAAPINHAQLHISKSPYGPWENVPGRNNADFIFEANNANPAPYICESASACLRRPSLPLTGLHLHLPLPPPAPGCLCL